LEILFVKKYLLFYDILKWREKTVFLMDGLLDHGFGLKGLFGPNP